MRRIDRATVIGIGVSRCAFCLHRVHRRASAGEPAADAAPAAGQALHHRRDAVGCQAPRADGPRFKGSASVP